MAVDPSVADVFDDSVAARRREELRAYIGPHAEAFMPVWASMQARASPRAPGEKRPRLKLGFVAMAFFLGPCWFFYRKMWAWACGLTAALFALSFLPGRVSAPVGILLALFGRQLYLGHAQKRVTRLRGAAEFADLDMLRRAGGVSPLAGWVSSAVIVAMAVLAVVLLGVLASMNGGHLPPDT